MKPRRVGRHRRAPRHVRALAAGLCAIGSTLVTAPSRAQDPEPPAPIETWRERVLTIIPTVGAQLTYTDNVRLESGRKMGDFITRGMFGLDAKVRTSRLTLDAIGQASYDLYARAHEQSAWSVVGNGAARLRLIGETLVLNADGVLSNGPISTFARAATDRAGVRGRVRLATFGVGPRLKTNIGDVASLSAAARFARVQYRSDDTQTRISLPGDDNITQLIGSIGTGARMRRYELLTSAELVDTQRGYRTVNGVQSVFVRVRPSTRLIARAGYERVSTPGVPRISAPILSAGIEFRPNARSKITAEGGRRYDRPAWAVEGDLQVTPKVRLSAVYTKTIQPDQVAVARSFRELVQRSEELQPANSVGAVGFPGNLYNETSLYRSAELRAVYADATNSAHLGAQWGQRKFLRTGGRDRTFVAQAGYERQVRPDLTVNLDAYYARTSASPVYGPSQSHGYTARLAYRANSTTTIDASIGGSRSRQLVSGGAKVTEHAIAIGLRKTL